MFWLKRLKADEAGTPWELSYGDMMSLLLGVFVLICTMSELRPTAKFSSVSGAMRSAFGFGALPEEVFGTPAQQLSLADRLRQAGLHRREAQDEDAALSLCDMVAEQDRLVIRVSGPASFDRHSARLKPQAERALQRIAGFLAGGRAQLEIRGHGGDGPVPPAMPLRDGIDLSYQRARTAADVLIRAGVQPQRVRITAWGDHDPLVGGGADATPVGVNRRLEIVVHAVIANQIAEKEQPANG